MPQEQPKKQEYVIKHTDTQKENRSHGRMYQLGGFIFIVGGFVGCITIPDFTVKDSFNAIIIGIILIVVGRVMEWIYSE